MAKDTPARLVQHEITQCLILGNPCALLPQGIAGWWGDAAYDNIAHFAFGVTRHDMDGLAAAHLDILYQTQGIIDCSMRVAGRHSITDAKELKPAVRIACRRLLAAGQECVMIDSAAI